VYKIHRAGTYEMRSSVSTQGLNQVMPHHHGFSNAQYMAYRDGEAKTKEAVEPNHVIHMGVTE